jgi:hypothetical protein
MSISGEVIAEIYALSTSWFCAFCSFFAAIPRIAGNRALYIDAEFLGPAEESPNTNETSVSTWSLLVLEPLRMHLISSTAVSGDSL